MKLKLEVVGPLRDKLTAILASHQSADPLKYRRIDRRVGIGRQGQSLGWLAALANEFLESGW
jgi:hypothetical protein